MIYLFYAFLWNKIGFVIGLLNFTIAALIVLAADYFFDITFWTIFLLVNIISTLADKGIVPYTWIIHLLLLSKRSYRFGLALFLGDLFTWSEILYPIYDAFLFRLHTLIIKNKKSPFVCLIFSPFLSMAEKNKDRKVE